MNFNPKEQWGSTEEGRKKLINALLSTRSTQLWMWVTMTLRPCPLDALCLQETTQISLGYTKLNCFARCQPAASASTFFRVLRSSGWRRKIKFRGYSTHAQCKICNKLKSAIKHSKDISEHAKASDLYMRHLGGCMQTVSVMVKQRPGQRFREMFCAALLTPWIILNSDYHDSPMEEHQNRWKINADLNWNSRAASCMDMVFTYFLQMQNNQLGRIGHWKSCREASIKHLPSANVQMNPGQIIWSCSQTTRRKKLDLSKMLSFFL